MPSFGKLPFQMPANPTVADLIKVYDTAFLASGQHRRFYDQLALRLLKARAKIPTSEVAARLILDFSIDAGALLECSATEQEFYSQLHLGLSVVLHLALAKERG
jgi:hypothetical protein